MHILFECCGKILLYLAKFHYLLPMVRNNANMKYKREVLGSSLKGKFQDEFRHRFKELTILFSESI